MQTNIDWLIGASSPDWLMLVPTAASFFGLFAAIILFASIKREMQRITRREQRRTERLIADRIGNSPESASASTSSPLVIPVPVPIRPKLDSNRRTHALRLVRKGEAVADVAVVMGIPRGEIELLVRVQAVIQQRLVEVQKEERNAAVDTISSITGAPLRDDQTSHDQSSVNTSSIDLKSFHPRAKTAKVRSDIQPGSFAGDNYPETLTRVPPLTRAARAGGATPD